MILFTYTFAVLLLCLSFQVVQANDLDGLTNVDTTSKLFSVAQVEKYGGGDGTSSSPFFIKTLDHLKTLSESPEDWSAHFLLMNDIDASDTRNWNVGDHDNNPETAEEPMGFTPIGNFEGIFNGNGNRISNLYINVSGQAGFIQVANASTISKLTLVACHINGGNDVGGVAAQTTNYASFINCGVHGTISGRSNVGGIIGQGGEQTLTNCFATATIYCQQDFAGGLSGKTKLSEITNCYFMGSVRGKSNVGGLIGSAFQTNITTSINMGYVSAANDNTGALIGKDSVVTITHCYYQTDIPNSETAPTGSGKTDGCLEFTKDKLDNMANFPYLEKGSSLEKPWATYICTHPQLYFESHIVNTSLVTEYNRADIRFCFVGNDYTDTIASFGIKYCEFNDSIWKEFNTTQYGSHVSLNSLNNDSIIFIQAYATSAKGFTYNGNVVVYEPKIQVNFVAGENGSIKGQRNQKIKPGQNSSAVEAIGLDGYHFVMWQNNEGENISEENPLTLNNIKSPIQLKAVFGINSYSFTAVSSGNGTSKSDRPTANNGEKVLFTLQADNGYKIDSVYYNSKNVTEDISIILTTCGFPSTENSCPASLATYTINKASEDGLLLTFFSKEIHSKVVDALNEQFKIYPNPTNGSCFVTLKNPATVTVLNANGSIVKQIPATSHKKIEINGLKPGVYIVQINSKTTRSRKKLLITN